MTDWVRTAAAPTSQDASVRNRPASRSERRKRVHRRPDRQGPCSRPRASLAKVAPPSGPVAPHAAKARAPVSIFRVYPDGKHRGAPDQDSLRGQWSAGGDDASGGHPAVMMTRNIADTAPSSAVASEDRGRACAGSSARQGQTRQGRDQSAADRGGGVSSAPVVAAAGGSGYYAQVGARNDQNQALAALAEVQSKYGSVLGSYAPVIHTADLGAKGVWYRVLSDRSRTRTAPAGLCEKLKGAGQKACLVEKE